MSDIKNSSYKNPSCGDLTVGTLKDILGGFVHLQIVGTDPHVGIISGPGLAVDYAPPTEHTNYGTFKIIVETDNAIFYVTLEDGSDFIITAAQSHRYLGEWYPANLLSVNVGSTGNFSVGY